MLVFTATSKYIFDPAMRAHMGDRVPYEKRGFYMTIVEMGWSGSFLLVVPVIGFFISRWGWLSPFPLLAVLSVVMGVVIFCLVPADSPPNNVSKNLLRYFRNVFSSSAARGGLVVSMLIALGSEIINLVFGVWLKESFGFQIVALGGTAAVIGFAELGGESLVLSIADRLGKRRAVSIGLFVTTLTALLLPVLGTNVTGALVSLFLFYLCYEFTFVSLNPIMTEVAPKSRATLLALAIASYAVGRWVAAWITPPLYAIGFSASAGVAGAIYFISWLVLRGMKIGEEGGSQPPTA
jgi:predicted MFS family arabinose efflux permease